MGVVKWTESALREVASKYETKTSFRSGDKSAYMTCITRFPGMIDTLFSNQNKRWDSRDVVLAEARKYTGRKAFKVGAPRAFAVARDKYPDILHEVFEYQRHGAWSLPHLIAEAQKYETRLEFLNNRVGAYAAFKRFPGELDRLFPAARMSWVDESDVRAEASKYRQKSEFQKGCGSAYYAALRMGIIDDLGFDRGKGGFDRTLGAYLYVAELFLTSGEPGVLLGITNRTPRDRYMSYDRVLITKRHSYWLEDGGKAREMENELRALLRGHWISRVDSPLTKKSGTTGEVLSGVSVESVVGFIRLKYGLEPGADGWGT